MRAKSPLEERIRILEVDLYTARAAVIELAGPRFEHLLGTHKSLQCIVSKIAQDLALEVARMIALYPRQPLNVSQRN
jgi:hypothetical protein